MPETCPKCGVVNKTGRSTCVSCGAELEVALFAELFGPPKQLSTRYTIQRLAKTGTAISLYHAVDTRNKNQPCLVHQVVLTSLALDSREIVEHRFLEKAARWKSCQHPNIVRILDADVQSHRLYLVTEPVRGISLRSIIRDRQQDITEEALLHWAGQLCDALEYMHSQEPPLVLGCLSPAAIHVDEAGQLRITEVGLVRYKQAGLMGPAKGVRGFAAPEQRQGETTVLSDLYTLGIILYQLITRANPQDRPLPALRKYARGMSDRVLDAVARAYRRDPKKRYTSAAEMRQALLGTSVESIAQLPPFVLTDGRVANSVHSLAQLCTTHWEDGLLALMTGRIDEWSSSTVDTLRADSLDKDKDAAQMEKFAQRAILAREQIKENASHPGLSSSAREIARNAAYASWLQDIGALGVQPSLEVHPTKFDFGVIGARIKAKSAVHIRNRGQGYLSGRVEATLPWLVVPDPVFGCRAGQEVTIRVEALGRRIPAGQSTSRQAVRISSNGGLASIEATASSSPPVLGVEQRVLSFGPITRGASRVKHLVVTNAGGGRLSGLVISRAPWLRVRHPSFSCPAGASAQIAVELLSEQLPKGAVSIRRALAVDSDSGQAQVDVAWKWARPTLELDTTGLDLGSTQYGTHVERTLTLTNHGTADLVGESTSAVAWLTVQPAQFNCAPGASQTLSIACDTASLPGGTTTEPEAITIRANAGTQIISASIEILAPRLVIQPSTIDFGSVADGDQVEETIMVGNQGSMSWNGRILSRVPWLSLESQEVHCEPGHFMPVTVMVHTEALESGGAYASENAIEIQGLEQECTIPARIHLLRPELTLERFSLDLGLIGRTDIVTVPLDIANSGTGTLDWEIAVQGTWLEIIPSSGSCGAGETTTVQVKAYALAVDGDTGQAWLTVRSNGGRIDLPASVSLSSPLLAVEPELLELDSENYAPVSRIVRVTNRGVGELEGTIESCVSWLDCSPSSFSCPTGAATQIEVRARLADLREGTHDALEALRVESNGGTEVIEARLVLALTPKLYVSTQELDIGKTSQALFQLENQGHGTLHARVTPREDWIAVNRRAWTIKAGRKARVEVTLVGAPPDATGIIEVHTANETVALSVTSVADSENQYKDKEKE